MNVTAAPRSLKTKAEEEIAAAYQAARASLPGTGAVARRRDAAFAMFERSGLPHRRVEAWKYTDLRALMRTVPPLVGDAEPATLAALDSDDPLAGLECARIIVANGAFRPDLSDLAGLDGVTVQSLADVLDTTPDRVGRLFADADDTVLALNTALMQGGVVVTVAADAKPARPIAIVHRSAVAAPASLYVRDVIDVGRNAAVRFVDAYTGPASVAYHLNVATELAIGDGAHVAFARLQAEGTAAVHLASLVARLAGDASLDHLVVSAGASLSRWQGFVTVAGSGARIAFNGANMLAGKEHGDLALVVEHAAPHSASRELFKNVVDGQAQGAFQGRIVVKQAAQKTDAKMMTKALLLSDSAEFASKPELEIFADDVQCGHGATSGRIDETMLFYLLARGIPRGEAERLLIEAFLADAIDAIGDEAIGEALKRTIGKWLARRGAEVALPKERGT
jgi:Fe-S cluster assembly protein SufD